MNKQACADQKYRVRDRDGEYNNSFPLGSIPALWMRVTHSNDEIISIQLYSDAALKNCIADDLYPSDFDADQMREIHRALDTAIDKNRVREAHELKCRRAQALMQDLQS